MNSLHKIRTNKLNERSIDCEARDMHVRVCVCAEAYSGVSYFCYFNKIMCTTLHLCHQRNF
jgi:hypothetical protein